jgi:hypothetical protein
MKLIKRNRNILLAAASCLLLTALPAVTLAQGRGLGRGHDQSWKCGKFVNCHDARNGRWDGRGPRTNSGVLSNGIFVSRSGRHQRARNLANVDRFRQRRARNRDFNNDNLVRQNRIRLPDRDFRNDNFFRVRTHGRRGR